MSIYDDIGRFNYGGVGATMTPSLMGGAGAQNPTGAYFQSAQAPAASSMMSGSGGANILGGMGAPGAGGLGIPSVGVGGAGGSGLGFNSGTLGLAIGGLQTIGSLWQAWQANKLAKEQFEFQKDFANTNLANQIQSYNTTLEDRGRSRAFTEGQSPEEAQAYIDENSLRKRKI